MEDVADSTDWLSTPLSGLAPLESGLRCQVCKDFFTTPMITSCSHTFCSLCIRRYLSQEGRCPACRESDQELKLRRNWALEEVVAHFTQARDGILKCAQQQISAAESVEEARPKKRRKVDHAPPVSNGDVSSRRSTRSQSKKTAVSASQASQELILSQEEIANSQDEGSVYDNEEASVSRKQPRAEGKNEKESSDGLVECPCCTRRMKESAINAHLDRCVSGLPTSPEPATAPATNGSLPFVQRTQSPIVTATKDRLPSINYALYSDASLRKKLKELGIPNHGSKELMRKRHTEWMNLWNANCDSLRPRTKRELLKDLDIWERTLGKQLEKTIAAGGASGVMVKDFDRDGWAKTRKSEFDDLIQKAREKGKAAAAAKQNNESTPDDKVKDEDIPMSEAMGAEGQLPEQSVTINGNAEPGSSRPESTYEQHDILFVNGHNVESHENACDDKAGKTTEIEAPGTPRKVDPMLSDHHSAIDLTASPGPDPGPPVNGVDNTETPRKRSRFFV